MKLAIDKSRKVILGTKEALYELAPTNIEWVSADEMATCEGTGIFGFYKGIDLIEIPDEKLDTIIRYIEV